MPIVTYARLPSGHLFNAFTLMSTKQKETLAQQSAPSQSKSLPPTSPQSPIQDIVVKSAAIGTGAWFLTGLRLRQVAIVGGVSQRVAASRLVPHSARVTSFTLTAGNVAVSNAPTLLLPKNPDDESSVIASAKKISAGVVCAAIYCQAVEPILNAHATGGNIAPRTPQSFSRYVQREAVFSLISLLSTVQDGFRSLTSKRKSATSESNSNSSDDPVSSTILPILTLGAGSLASTGPHIRSLVGKAPSPRTNSWEIFSQVARLRLQVLGSLWAIAYLCEGIKPLSTLVVGSRSSDTTKPKYHPESNNSLGGQDRV